MRVTCPNLFCAGSTSTLEVAPASFLWRCVDCHLPVAVLHGGGARHQVHLAHQPPLVPAG